MNKTIMTKTLLSRVLSFLMIFSVLQMGGSSGCAAGNWRALRWVASINSVSPLGLKVLLYIGLVLIGVYPIAFLVDIIILNTMDFWSGSKVANSNHHLEKDGYIYAIENRVLEDGLRQTQVQITHPNQAVSNVALVELSNKKIDLIVNGVKKIQLDKVDDLFEVLRGADALGQLGPEIKISPRELSTPDAKLLFAQQVAAKLTPVMLSKKN